MEVSKIITPGQNLIDPAYDQFLDGKPTRRELQATFQKIGTKMTELFQAVDTQALVANFLCERAGVTREEIEAYVAKKAKEVEAFTKAALEAAKAEATKAAEEKNA